MRNATAYYVAVERASEQTHERSGTAGAPLSSDLTGRASATRALAVVTSHPPATADEAEAPEPRGRDHHQYLSRRPYDVETG